MESRKLPEYEAHNGEYQFDWRAANRRCKDFCKECAIDVGGNLPDYDYVIGTFIGYLQGANLGQGLNFSEASVTGMTVGWNYLDAVAGLITATTLLLDKTNYQQIQNKIKASLMIFSSAQALAFSYAPWLGSLGVAGLTSATALAGPAFALSALIDLSVAAIDLHYSIKELKFEGWLEERVKEWNHLQEQINRIADKLKITGLKNSDHLENDNDASEKKKEKLQEKLISLQNKQRELYEDIQGRCIANRRSDNDAFIRTQLRKTNIADYTYDSLNNNVNANNLQSDYMKYKNEVRKIQSNDSLQHTFKQYIDNDTNATNSLEIYKTYCKQQQLKGNDVKLFQKDNAIQNKQIDQYNKKVQLVGAKSLSFIGCTLLAIAPFTGPAAPALFAAGAVICGAVALYYVYNQREAIMNTVKPIAAVIQQKLEKSFEGLRDDLAVAIRKSH